MTVDALAQSGLGKLIKYVVEHPPTNGESFFLFSLRFLLCHWYPSSLDTRACYLDLLRLERMQYYCTGCIGGVEMMAHYSTFTYNFFLQNLFPSVSDRKKRKRNQKNETKNAKKEPNTQTKSNPKRAPARLGGLLCLPFSDRLEEVNLTNVPKDKNRGK